MNTLQNGDLVHAFTRTGIQYTQVPAKILRSLQDPNNNNETTYLVEGHGYFNYKDVVKVEPIKERTAKVSPRGIYIQDKELRETDFQIGKHFSYSLDTESGVLTIVVDDSNVKNTVSKREMSDGLKPVLDIRDKKVREFFTGEVQVNIYKDRITVKALN